VQTEAVPVLSGCESVHEYLDHILFWYPDTVVFYFNLKSIFAVPVGSDSQYLFLFLSSRKGVHTIAYQVDDLQKKINL
jgi:hypothetical protein